MPRQHRRTSRQDSASRQRITASVHRGPARSQRRGSIGSSSAATKRGSRRQVRRDDAQSRVLDVLRRARMTIRTSIYFVCASSRDGAACSTPRSSSARVLSLDPERALACSRAGAARPRQGPLVRSQRRTASSQGGCIARTSSCRDVRASRDRRSHGSRRCFAASQSDLMSDWPCRAIGIDHHEGRARVGGIAKRLRAARAALHDRARARRGVARSTSAGHGRRRPAQARQSLLVEVGEVAVQRRPGCPLADALRRRSTKQAAGRP